MREKCKYCDQVPKQGEGVPYHEAHCDQNNELLAAYKHHVRRKHTVSVTPIEDSYVVSYNGYIMGFGEDLDNIILNIYYEYCLHNAENML